MTAKHLDSIIELLIDSDKEYYSSGTSKLTDEEYDDLKQALEALDPNNPYFNEVGAEDIDNSHWEKKMHSHPLGSLAKVQNMGELKKWYAGLVEQDIVLQGKLDGISIALTYEQGKLVSGVTRGKGGIGDDITRNVLKMKGVPETISCTDTIVVRGEIVMTYEDFAKLPSDKKKKNPRNTTAGAAKKLTGELCGFLTVIIYDLMNAQALNISLETEAHAWLKKHFDQVVETHTINDFTSLQTLVEQLTETRADFGYDIDGLVIKSNTIHVDDDWKKPKFKIAYKFEHQEVHTILLDVAVSIKGNRIQPIAMLEPVDVGGVTVSKASLHHWKRVKELGLTKNAKVLVSRRNDVIPQVEQVLEDGTEAIDIPTQCPCCESVLSYEVNTDGSESPFLICDNDECDAKVVKHVMKWLRIHDSKGIAEKTVELLFYNDIFTDLPSFLELSDGTKDKSMLSLDGMGKSKVDTLKAEISKTRVTNPIKFFAGLNLNGFGRGTFENICEQILTYEDFADHVLILQLIQQPFELGLGTVEGFAEPSAQKLQSTISANAERIKAVESLVDIKQWKPETPTGNSCAGKSFCFTGALEIVRKEAEAYVKANGGKVASVSKTLDYLVTDDIIDPEGGTNKMKKACALGITIITGDQFTDLIKKG